VNNFNEIFQKATQTARDEGFAQMGQRIVITAGVPFGTPGATNVLRIAWVDA
ncbi:MAG: pyruvate kinase alpha/beta domain-containing protein, partial [Stellaceae bacterium]